LPGNLPSDRWNPGRLRGRSARIDDEHLAGVLAVDAEIDLRAFADALRLLQIIAREHVAVAVVAADEADALADIVVQDLAAHAALRFRHTVQSRAFGQAVAVEIFPITRSR
jgi:hypothetical protein